MSWIELIGSWEELSFTYFVGDRSSPTVNLSIVICPCFVGSFINYGVVLIKEEIVSVVIKIGSVKGNIKEIFIQLLYIVLMEIFYNENAMFIAL